MTSACALAGARETWGSERGHHSGESDACLRYAALLVVRESQQQVLQVRESMAHVQCTEIPVTHELIPCQGLVSDISLVRHRALTISMSLFSRNTPYSKR